MPIFLFALGLLLLMAGAELLVRGASRLAAALGITPLVVGLTVVAFGTSAPELAVSVKAALAGQAGIALGNVIGSNIFNVLFILGVSALVAPLAVSQQLIRLDVPLLIGVSILVFLFGLDGKFGRLDGLALVMGLVGYTAFLVYQSRRESEEVRDEYAQSFGVERTTRTWPRDLGLVLSGLVLLVLGSRWLVEGAVSVARHLGVSELVIALTMVAAGTSLPEVFTSVVASIRGERDIAVGNVVGSNLFNLMGVLGPSGIVASDGMEVSTAITGFDLPVMIVVAFACLPIFFTGGVISRFEGGLLLGYYLAYALYLLLAAAHHDALPVFSGVMLYFAIPLTLVTLLVVALRERHQGRRPSP